MRFMKTAAIVALTAAVALSTAFNTFPSAYAISSGANNLTEEKGLVSGIVKENNPSLGYLTMYFQDGSGSDPMAFNRLTSIRNFTYGYEIPVFRDGVIVTADSIEPGDQVFLKLDEEGYIVKLSAKSYYKPVYGTVHIKTATALIIKKDNGIYVHYPLAATIPIYKNGQPGSITDINDGERVKLLVQTDGENIDIGSIDIEKTPKPVTGIYRGDIEFFNTMRDSLVISGVEEFVNGRWENSSVIGIQSVGFNSDYKSRPSKRVSGTAYFAIKKATDGTKKIVAASYRAVSQYESTIKDNLLNLGDEILELENNSDSIKFDKNTLVIKDGRLVDISALDTLDPVKVSMERSAYGNDYLATVLVSETTANNKPVIYRGRIEEVETGESITLESFAQLDGVTWEFTNTPKTLDIKLSSSRFVDEDGIGNMREFDSSFEGQSVYIVANGTTIQLISTAPYADSPVSGRILSFTEGTFDNFGEALSDPSGLKLSEAMIYNTEKHKWSKSANLNIAIPGDAVVVKKGQVGNISLLRMGDQIKIIRHVQSKDGILVLCD